MATKPLQSIKFPGLDDRYTVPQVDSTLQVTGAAADAKKTGDEIGQLNERLSNDFANIDNGYMSLSAYGQFQNGALYYATGEPVSGYDYRVCSKNIITVPHKFTLKAKTGFKFAILYYNNGVYTNNSEQNLTEKIINENQQFKLTIFRTTEDTSEKANVETFVSSLIFSTVVNENVEFNSQYRTANCLSTNEFNLVRGGIASDGTETNTDAAKNIRLRTDFIRVFAGDVVKPNLNLTSICYYSLTKAYIDVSGWLSDNATIQSDGYIRIVLRKNTSDGTILDADIDTLGASTFIIPSYFILRNTYDIVMNDVIGNTDFREINCLTANSFNLVRGGIASDGSEVNTDGAKNIRLRTDYIRVFPGDIIKVNPNLTSLVIYNQSKVFVSLTGWTSSDYTVVSDGFIRILLRKNTSDGVISDADITTLGALVFVYPNLFALRNYTPDETLYSYTGETINLNPHGINVLSPKWAFTEPNPIGDYRYGRNGSDIYNGKLVKCYSPNPNTPVSARIGIFDLATGSQVGDYYELNIDHGNAMQFTDVFDSIGDSFPLAYISEYRSVTDASSDCYISLCKIGDASGSIIKTYKLPTNQCGYFGEGVYDKYSNKLYCLGYSQQSATDGTNNHSIASVWDLSTETANEDGTYTPTFEKSFDLEFINTDQDMKWFNGKLYVVSSNPATPNTTIYGIDFGKETIVTVIGDLPTALKNYECEDLIFYKTDTGYKMYIGAYFSGLYEIII